jgi:hypothetical protein
VAAAAPCSGAQSSWTGSSSSDVVVAAGGNIQAALDAAPAGGTVWLADGTWVLEKTITIATRVRLAAQNPGEARLRGATRAPNVANESAVDSVNTPLAILVQGSGADGTQITGLDLAYFDMGMRVDGVADISVHDNQITSNFGSGIVLWDTRDVEVSCNRLQDPYLPDDPRASLTAQSISTAQMDYGVAVYGSIRPKVVKNGFSGVFNQAMSFKESNEDPYAADNRFDGFNLTALFFGQNRPGKNGPYQRFGLPAGPDRGRITAQGNTFRPGGSAAEGVYFAETAIRVWHVDGTVVVADNDIGGALIGIQVECRNDTAEEGCAKGTVELRRNIFDGVGTVGTLSEKVGYVALDLFRGKNAPITLSGNKISNYKETFRFLSLNYEEMPTVIDEDKPKP